MFNRVRADVRVISRAGLGLAILLLALVFPALPPEQARAQGASTPTVRIPHLFQPQATLIAPPIVITKSVPTFVVTNLGVLNLESAQLTGQTTRTTADINFEDQFKATVNVESPSSMLLGESRVITLEVIPELLAQASMVRAELQAVRFDSADDGHPEKTVIVNTPVRWNWNIAPREVGQQEFFLAISYVNNYGSRVHWQNITLKMTVSRAATPTDPGTATFIATQTDSAIGTIILMPVDTHTPTWTPSATNSPEATFLPTLTPTRTFAEKVSEDVAENPATYLGTLVTLVLGLLGVYFQYIRKRDKDSGIKPKGN